MNLHRLSIHGIVAFSLFALVGCGDVTVVVADAGGERADNRCGPTYGNARCGTNRCCSTASFCGGLTETHCTTDRGFNGMFDGPRVVERSDNRCGPSYANARCGANRCCSTSDFCGGLTETHCTTTRGYNGMFDGPRM